MLSSSSDGGECREMLAHMDHFVNVLEHVSLLQRETLYAEILNLFFKVIVFVIKPEYSF